MRKVKWSIIALLGFLLLYSLAWLFITFAIAQQWNGEYAGRKNIIFGFNNESYQIAFEKATPYGFPFKFGIKIHNLTEETTNSLVSHKEPLSIGYDVLLQKFYMAYKGKSTARPKPLNAGFGTEINGEFAHYLTYFLRPGIFKILMHPERGFELINFVKSIQFTSKDVKAYDIIDKSLLFDESYLSFKLTVLGKPYYNTIEEFKANPPSFYNLTSSSKINRVVNGRRIAVGSIVYGILPSHAFNHKANIDLVTKAKSFTLSEFIKNMELKSHSLSFEDESENWVGDFTYKSISAGDALDISIHYAASSSLKASFLERRLEICKSVAQDLMDLDGPVTFLKPALNAFLENPKKYLPPHNNISKTQTALDFKLHGEDNQFKFEIENFSFLADDVGFRLQNTSSLDNLFAWKTSGVLYLSKYKDSIDFATDYANQILDKNEGAKSLGMNKDVRKNFLHIISNHPESDSSDLVFDYEFSSNLADGKIGTSNMTDVIALYYNTLYRKAIEMAKSEPDFKKALAELAPELLAKPELLKTLLEK